MSTTVPSRFPRRGNAFSRGLGTGLLRLFGWRFEGELPDVSRCVIIGAPHTSNWDFYFGICAVYSLGLRVEWIGKHTLFRAPFGWFMRWLGGIPVTRRPGEGVVDAVVRRMNERESVVLGLSPEGTRRRVERWRTGFYHIAVGARVPILLGYFDYARKRVGVGPLFHPTGDLERDLVELRRFYDDKTARYPHLA